MDVNIGIDSKPRTRRGRRGFSGRLITSASDRNDDINDPIGMIGVWYCGCTTVFITLSMCFDCRS